MSFTSLKFGVFFSSPDTDPDNTTSSHESDRQLVLLLDELGYEYAWFEEQNTSGSADPFSVANAAIRAVDHLKSITPGLCSTPNAYQHLPTNPRFSISVASQHSPAGARVAGTYGAGLISIDATTPGGFNSLRSVWEVYGRYSSKASQVIDRNNWSLVGPVHIAKSRKQAIEDVKFGLEEWAAQVTSTTGADLLPGDIRNVADYLVESGLAVIGTPTDAISQIKRLQQQTGGFGAFLQMKHNWADQLRTKLSVQLFAEKVMPKFRSSK